MASPWPCLNTSTLRGQRLPIVELAEIAARAGFHGLEPWLEELDRYEAAGGSLEDLGARLRDLGLAVPCVIDFAEWLVDDDARRARGLEHARRSAERLARAGATGVAAAPAGCDGPVDLDAAADRYRALLEIGDEHGVTPYVEFWGKSPALRTLEQAVAVAARTGHPRAAVLADVYHLYKGGSDPEDLARVEGSRIGCFHVNDYPGDPPRTSIEDRDRVFPGQGIAPLDRIARILRDTGYAGPLSLELFHPGYWARDPHEVAREGRAAIRTAFGV